MKRIALCIGNDKYTILPELRCAVADATAMADKLKNLGFDTELKTNLSRRELADAIFSFTNKIENCDAVLIYYAGHGFQIDGENILAHLDLNIQDTSKMILYDAFRLSELTEELNKYPDKIKIVILDACRNILGHRGATTDFAPVSAPQGAVIAFSTSPGQSSKENISSGHGYYTEALLKYIDLPRIPIETTFKKVREFLYAKTGGTQVPWEHTSLVGEFYFNPDTIYDGVSYIREAYEDRKFRFSTDSIIKEIVEELKSHTWPKQEAAIRRINEIDFQTVSTNELFVLGRNIYQAADGNCYACQRCIDNFSRNNDIPAQAKQHILNGMAYEIYFDSSNNLRLTLKTGYYQKIIDCLEQAQFYGSREFIAAKLTDVSDRIFYIPGQNETMDFIIRIYTEENKMYLNDIIYRGKSVYYDEEGIEKPQREDCMKKSRYQLTQEIAQKVAAPYDRINLQSDSPVEQDSEIFVPDNGFTIKY